MILILSFVKQKREVVREGFRPSYNRDQGTAIGIASEAS